MSSAAASASKHTSVWPKVVLLGDSLTQHAFDEDGGWGTKLASLLKRKADVLNRGFSGYSTSTLKLILPRIFNQGYFKDVACLTLCIGANDSWFPTKNKFNPSVPVDEYRENLIEIIEFLLNSGLTKDKLLLITPPTIISEDWNNFCGQNFKDSIVEKTPEHTKKYVDTMLDVAGQLNIKCFDSFELTSKVEHCSKAFFDGLHLSKYGGDLFYELIKGDVEQCVQKFRNTDLEILPNCDDIDFNNLDKFFN